MSKNKVSINIISSFNHTNFVSLLGNSETFDYKINSTDYNQVFQTLGNHNLNIWKKKANITLVWTTPESISSEFKKLLNQNKINQENIKRDVDYFCSALKSIKKYSDIVEVKLH